MIIRIRICMCICIVNGRFSIGIHIGNSVRINIRETRLHVVEKVRAFREHPSDTWGSDTH